jgi:hypothetical protein
MTKKTPSWFDRPFGNYDQNTWDDAVERGLEVLREWATRGHYDTYGEFIRALDRLEWPDGPYQAYGAQVGHLLGCIGVRNWLDDSPLTTSLVVHAEPGGGKGFPGNGWFDFCSRLGLLADEKAEDQRLKVWNEQVKACFAGRRFAYPTETPDW